MIAESSLPILLVSVLLNGLLAIAIWGLKATLTGLRADVNALRETLWEDMARKSELAEAKADISALYDRLNAQAVACAKQHGARD
ncbi:hypothetical protein dsx2_2630 [Desulfovibrio sp. X2]|uniref:hypothetical protein n=1 Tax=Desulfovibrio sp. X2 TaxID=941449 RepID=UPI000358AF14|nr:hypothetical protein [Desulfovibrio sp. X2]EPR42713.1 hypothetical protein dsx2_2630 [Desulfovibrio sp. X2]